MKANIYFSTELTSDAEAESEIWQVRDISPDIRAGIWMLSLLFVNLKALPKDQSTLVHQLLVTIYFFFSKLIVKPEKVAFFVCADVFWMFLVVADQWFLGICPEFALWIHGNCSPAWLGCASILNPKLSALLNQSITVLLNMLPSGNETIWNMASRRIHQ